MTNYDSYLNNLAQELGLGYLANQFKRDYTYSDGLKISLDILETNPDAPTVVFIPGTALYALCYAELLATVAENGYNVVGFDPRGHGRSEGERGDFTLEAIVRDTQAVITYAIENYNDHVSVIGARQGGVVALHVAAADDRIKSAICHNLADLSDPLSKKLNIYPSYTKLLKPIFFGLASIFPKMSISVWRHLNVKKEKLRYFGDTRQFIKKDPLVLKRIKIKSLKSFSTARLARSIDEISIPVFVLQPEEDPVFSLEYTKKIFSKLNCKKKMEVFKGLNHTMMTENVNILSPAILTWLSDIHQKDYQVS